MQPSCGALKTSPTCKNKGRPEEPALNQFTRNNPQEFWGLYILLVTISEPYGSKAFSARTAPFAPPVSLCPAASSFTRGKKPRTGKSENQPPDYNQSLPNPILASPLDPTFCMLETKFYLTLQPMTQTAGHITCGSKPGSEEAEGCLSAPQVTSPSPFPRPLSTVSAQHQQTATEDQDPTSRRPPVAHPGSVLNMEMFRGQFPLRTAKKRVQKVWNSNKVTGSRGGMQTAAVLIKKFTMSHRTTVNNTQHILTRQVSIQKYTRWQLVFQRLQARVLFLKRDEGSQLQFLSAFYRREARGRVYKMYFTWQDNKQVYKEKK